MRLKPSRPGRVDAVRIALQGLALSGLAANAQEYNPTSANTVDLPEVIVTGTRIPEPIDVAISPVISVTAETIERSGVTRIEDLLNSLPQVYAGQNANVSNGADGTAEVNLRGLGSVRTLVLVNGRRLGPGDSSGNNNSDLNQIPAPLIERIEILTGGASSVYGADAVAGVVNFKLLDHFEGVRLIANYGFFNHTNTNAQGVVDAVLDWNATTGGNYPLAPDHTNGGANKELSLVAGFNSSDGSGNATFYATYRTAEAVLQSNYSYSACALASGYLAGENSTGGKFQCAGSYTSYPGSFQLLDPATGQPLDLQTIGAGNTAIPFTDANLYNYGPLNYFQREDERYTGGALLHYQLNEHAIAYAEAQYMEDRTTAQIAPSGAFYGTGPYAINCNNPELSVSMVNDWCAGSRSGDANLFIGRRNIEGGPRLDDFEHRSWRVVLGMHGRIDDSWQYDVSGQYAEVATQHDSFNDMSIMRITNSLRVVSYNSATGTIGSGAPTCTAALPSSLRNVYPEAGTDPQCVPWNIFQIGGPNAAATDYLEAQLSARGTVTQRIADANFTGDLGAYGLRVPMAKANVKVNVGAEWRQETSTFNPSPEYQSGDAAGIGVPTPPVAGEITVAELFAEAHIPLVAGQRWAEALDFETGYRFSAYRHAYDTNTYKFGLEWAPERSVRLRGSWARAVRAPNIAETFYPQILTGDGSTDPCWGSKPLYSLAQCERTGVKPAQYGNIAEPPAGNGFNGIAGGNPRLVPEAATTVSFGVGWSPPFLPRLRVQADYYDIQIDRVIQNIGGDTIVQQCALAGLFCNLIKRDAYGSLWLTPKGYVIDTLTNVGAYIERGVDVELGYIFDTGTYGTVRAELIGTYMIDGLIYPIQQLNSSSYDCAGYYGRFCGAPTFRWRHTARVTWESPWRGGEVSLAWRYFSPVALDALSPNPNLAAPPGQTVANGGISNTDARLSSRSYFDLSTAGQLGSRVSFRLGINNLLDKVPPIVGSANGAATNGNTFASVYDSLGRYIFATLTARF